MKNSLIILALAAMLVLPQGAQAQTEAPPTPNGVSINIGEYPSTDAMPGLLRRLATVAGMPKGVPIMVFAQEYNDCIFTPPGILAFLVAPQAENIRAKSYDMGDTHRFTLGASKTSADGVTTTLQGSSALYTMADGRPNFINAQGLLTIPIFHTEQNIISYFRDNEKSAINSPRKNIILWKSGVGFEQLNSQTVTPGLAAWQQEQFHGTTSKANPNQHIYIYEKDGTPVQNSTFLDFALGLSHLISQNGKIQFRASGNVEGQIFTTTAWNDVTARVSLDAYLKSKNALTTFKAGENTTFWKGGTEFTPVLSIRYERKKWGVETNALFPMGSLENNVRYNWTNHPMNSLTIFTFIGNHKTQPTQKQ